MAIRAALQLKRSVAPFVAFSVMSGKPQGAADWMSLVRIAVMQEVGFSGAFQWQLPLRRLAKNRAVETR